jgi:hypothetical protein
LQGKQLPISKSAAKTSFHLKNFCKLRRATTERERKAFFWFFLRSWNVFVGQERGEMRRKPFSYRSHEISTMA